MTLDLTTDELREIQDALASEIRRMCEAGQTPPQQREYQSLTQAWSAPPLHRAARPGLAVTPTPANPAAA